MARMATVDLTTGRVDMLEAPAELLRDYLGGRGLGARLLYDLVGPEVDPLGCVVCIGPVRYGLLHDFDAMLDRYYQLRGWTPDGKPTTETLRRIALSV